ncbi:class I SAM-dependent methyltransferase [Roseibacillus ishigakijimensis]|uniref:Class I SAM-dependent methyltransferase n=1 Tax=Roseibacillus ishigakijimensis TaxID=454146 RepID=A0A934RN82_9BACT|nr:class I SAM-dependent methyltransferase [Roseibacillus ishigakijimensis]MBK1833890.1 class I SAM-dependent methyltransferase [Roseibacillus ishigakijimensis]
MKPAFTGVLIAGLVLVLALAGTLFFQLEPSSSSSTEDKSSQSAPLRPEAYTFAPASPDGIGKFYLGREIARVMGHEGIGWLERDNREEEEAPSEAIDSLGIEPDHVIADIGAGSGYYTFRLAPLVPEGRVIAVDIQPEMIDFLTHRAQGSGVRNVQPHLSTIDSLELPPASVDVALMVDVYHEFSHPVEMLASIYRTLRPGGRIFLLEYRAEDENVPIKPLHKMSEEQAIRELSAAGFHHQKTLRHLPWQHLMIFEKKAP